MMSFSEEATATAGKRSAEGTALLEEMQKKKLQRGAEDDVAAAQHHEKDTTVTPARRWFLANQAVEANPSAAGFVVRAVAFLSMSRPWEAAADLDRALRYASRGGGSADEEARIRLLRGHAHTSCLSYDRAAADFATAYDILQSLEEDDTVPRTAERATPAHAKAGLAVVYSHMRRWSDAIRTGEAAIDMLKFDDVARLHASRAVETARQHLAAERRGRPVEELTPRKLHYHSYRGAQHSATASSSTTRMALSVRSQPSSHHHHHRDSDDASSYQPRPQQPQQQQDSPFYATANEQQRNSSLSMGNRELSAMSMASLPKNLSIASLAMSLSMASIHSENWEVGDIPDDVLEQLDSGIVTSDQVALLDDVARSAIRTKQRSSPNHNPVLPMSNPVLPMSPPPPSYRRADPTVGGGGGGVKNNDDEAAAPQEDPSSSSSLVVDTPPVVSSSSSSGGGGGGVVVVKQEDAGDDDAGLTF